MRSAPPGCSSGCAAPSALPAAMQASAGARRSRSARRRTCAAYATIPESAAQPNAHRWASPNIDDDQLPIQNLRGATGDPDPDDEIPDEPVHAAMDLSAAPYQQTLKKSFTVRGLGLHTAEAMTLRVRPAHANDGRYFVRVPEGTNEPFLDEEETVNAAMQEVATELDPFAKEKQTAVYMRYVREQQGGYAGSFNEYIAERGLEGEVLPIVDRGEIDAAEQFASAVAAEDSGDEGDEGDGGDGGGLDLDEEIVEKIAENGPFMDATYESMLANSPWTTMLGAEPEDPHALVGVEILLGTLEALHIDNARIEISGGNEIPALDGSAQPWLEHIEIAGIRPALRPGAEAEDCVRKFAWKPHTPISIYDDHGAFITLYPCGLEYKLTVGVERDSMAIGTQWVTLDAQQFTPPYTPFAVYHAPARHWIESQSQVDAMVASGYLRGMSSANTMIADGERWISDGSVRFDIDEPARHQMIRTLGDLALLGEHGNSGIPCGHLVVYNASHALMHQFLRRVRECMSDGVAVPWPFMLLPQEIERLQAGETEEIAARESGEIPDAAAEAGMRKLAAEDTAQEGLRMSTRIDELRAEIDEKRAALDGADEEMKSMSAEAAADVADAAEGLRAYVGDLEAELSGLEADLAALDARTGDDADVHAAYDRIVAAQEAKEGRGRVMAGVGDDLYDFGDVSDLLDAEEMAPARAELEERGFGGDESEAGSAPARSDNESSDSDAADGSDGSDGEARGFQ